MSRPHTTATAPSFEDALQAAIQEAGEDISRAISAEVVSTPPAQTEQYWYADPGRSFRGTSSDSAALPSEELIQSFPVVRPWLSAGATVTPDRRRRV